MRIMQRKTSNKLGIQTNSLKLEKRQTTKKPSFHNHDSMSLGSDLKAKKMKTSRSINRFELEGDLGLLPIGYETLGKPGEPPPLETPNKTPSPKIPTSLKSPYGSPNYMKSTSSSEARKEQRKVSSSSSSKLHKVSSLKKVRTLTKVPSFKHTRTGGNKCSKVVLCDDLDVKRATCSSTLKDSTFPSYLMLNHGVTEAEGTSVMKVCPYTYCSLNGHHHKPVPSLKCFLSSKRKVMKTQRVVKPEAVSPRKPKLLNKDVKGVEFEDQKDDFFVEIYIPQGEVDAGNESICSLDDPQTPKLIKVDDSISVSLDEYFGESSDMEWEEGQFSDAYVDSHSESFGQEKQVLKSDETVDRNLEESMDDKQLVSYYQEEIAEWLNFSDVGSMPDSDSTQSGEELIEEINMIEEEDYINASTEDEAIICGAETENKYVDEQGDVLSVDPIDETIEAASEDFDSYHDLSETHYDEANEDNETVEDVAEETESTENTVSKIDNLEDLSSMEESLQEGNNRQDECNDKESPEDSNKTEQIKKGSYCRKGTDLSEEVLNNCIKLKRSMRCKKEDVETEERDFNPKEPNFLPVEADPESEKVDLRHQEMDERRNSEEWMLDHALQRTVNQLAPARKRKVALLVEAFESVLPVPKWEPHMRRNSSGFAHSRPIQACS